MAKELIVEPIPVHVWCGGANCGWKSKRCLELPKISKDI